MSPGADPSALFPLIGTTRNVGNHMTGQSGIKDGLPPKAGRKLGTKGEETEGMPEGSRTPSSYSSGSTSSPAPSSPGYHHGEEEEQEPLNLAPVKPVIKARLSRAEKMMMMSQQQRREEEEQKEQRMKEVPARDPEPLKEPVERDSRRFTHGALKEVAAGEGNFTGGNMQPKQQHNMGNKTTSSISISSSVSSATNVNDVSDAKGAGAAAGRATPILSPRTPTPPSSSTASVISAAATTLPTSYSAVSRITHTTTSASSSVVGSERDDDEEGGDGLAGGAIGGDNRLLTKKEIRMLKNRESAARSRKRKRDIMESLESEVRELRGKNAALKAKLGCYEEKFGPINDMASSSA